MKMVSIGIIAVDSLLLALWWKYVARYEWVNVGEWFAIIFVACLVGLMLYGMTREVVVAPFVGDVRLKKKGGWSRWGAALSGALIADVMFGLVYAVFVWRLLM